MKKNILKGISLIGFLFLSFQLLAQERILIHSHNDYQRRVPLYQAYSQQLSSIEIDIYERNGELVVAHDRHEVATAKTIDELYIEPIVGFFKDNGGKPWADSENTFSILVDLKTPANPTLDILTEKLAKYQEVFNVEKNPYGVKVIISGNRPDPKDFHKYPSFIYFDGDKLDYTEKELEKIAMISFSLKENADWNGKGMFKKPHQEKVEALIEGVHKLGKPIRFWAAPDGVNAWNKLHTMGVDYINTDMPEACADFFRNFANKNYTIAGHDSDSDDETQRYKKLDKVTANFEGFKNKKLQLSKTIDIYQPTYKNDGSQKKIKNVILLIGDGTGLNQLQVAATANNPGYKNGQGLSIFNMKYLGFHNTSAQDSYTTDSAAGGSALATGELHDNRHISMSNTGESYPSLTDYMYNAGYACGVITLGNLADATPAAFYGHATERDDSDKITEYLLEGKLTLLNGSGMNVFTKRADGRDILKELENKGYRIATEIDDINDDNKKVICVDESMELAATEESLELLAEATKEGIEKLTKTNNRGFFLMVEGAKIDYAGHANSLPGSIVETLSFDLAVAEALKFADQNGETLVIVTGDHETGGLTLVDGDVKTGHITARYMTDDHTAQMLPVFAYGPGASEFIGVYKNTEIFHKIMKVKGLSKNKK